ncbi:MAG TPA: hypothetical protein VFU28_11690 [Vicinamibacterales bacterium]|nr:hypothetical protein [Vicinamibacterales bacterium]
MNSLRHVVPRPIRRAASAFLAQRKSERLQRELAAMATRGIPIVAGPWLGEVGFELLYWVPFLRWCAERLTIDPERFVVVSRGGTENWYRPFASRYADVFDQVTAEMFREQHDARVRDLGEQKQTRITEFDREIVAAAMRHAQVREWSLLHPSLMYDVLNPYWWGHQADRWVHNHVRYARLDTPPKTDVLDLPPRYVAAKFYFNECFPATPQNRAFVRDALRTFAAVGPVVALSTGLNIDDHRGDRVDEHGVRHLPEGLDPARNLHIQSAIVAGADAFVGTYGGFSYMAPFHGVKSLAFYSDPGGFSQKHLHMARSAFDQIGASGLLEVRDAAGGADIAGDVSTWGHR